MKQNLVCLVTLALISLGVGAAQDPTVGTLGIYLPPGTTSLGDCSGEAMSQCDFAKHALPLDSVDNINSGLSTSDNPSFTFPIEEVSHQYGSDEMRDSVADLVDEMTVTFTFDKERMLSSRENGDIAVFDSLTYDQQEELKGAGATIIIIVPNGPIGVCYCRVGSQFRLFNQLFSSFILSQYE